jgi:hypothetical protein
LTRNKILKNTTSFECLHGISCILGAIDGSHVPIIPPNVDPKSYYCWKSLYSTLTQGVVDAKCSLWNYDYGWASSIHDWVLFQKNRFRKTSDGKQVFSLQVIGDAIYIMHHGSTLHLKVRKMGHQNT